MPLRFLAFGLLIAVGALSGPFAAVRAQTVVADADRRIVALGDLLQMGEVIEVMRVEGIENAVSLEAEMFPGQGGARWQAVADQIYDPVAMRANFDAALLVQMAGDDALLRDVEAFFASDLGKRVVTLEIAARRALLDDAAEEAAQVALQAMTDDKDARLTRLQDFAEVNDLVESNVMGALNANLAFYRGLAEVSGFSEDLTEEQMLSDVWAQEDDIRAETEEWLYPFLALAYEPISDADLAAYHDFSASPAGQKVNAALFVAFDGMFTEISRNLGRAVARQMQGQDL